MKNLSVKTFVATGIGAALFFVLGRFVAIPIFANTNLSLQYVVLGFFAVVYGPVSGLLVGLIGHALIDFTSWGPWWSWIVTSALVGLVIGLICNKIDLDKGEFTGKDLVRYLIATVAAHLIGWVGVAPALDILIYQEPTDKIFVQGALSATANILTSAIIGALLLFAYAKTRTKTGSLQQEGDDAPAE